MRFRNIYLGLGSALVLIIVFLSDPSVGLIAQLPFGSVTLGLILNIVISLFYIGLLHFSRKALVDYIDLEVFFKKAYETSQGAAVALVAVGLIMVSIGLVVIAATMK